MAVNKTYAAEIHDNLGGFLATWLPNAPIALGDVGLVENSIFTKIGTIGDYGIRAQGKITKDRVDLQYSSAGAVEIDGGVAGNAPVTGGVPAHVDADVAVTFKRANAILFQASQCQYISIDDIGHVGDAIIGLFDAGDWPKNQVVVTDLVLAAATTVLISSGQDAHVTLSVKGNIGAGDLKLASANANIGVKSSRSLATSIVSQRDLTPLFTARGVRSSIWPWNDPKFLPRAGKTVFDPVGYKDILEVGPGGTRGG